MARLTPPFQFFGRRETVGTRCFGTHEQRTSPAVTRRTIEPIVRIQGGMASRAPFRAFRRARIFSRIDDRPAMFLDLRPRYWKNNGTSWVILPRSVRSFKTYAARCR